MTVETPRMALGPSALLQCSRLINLSTGHSVRQASRTNKHTTHTSGLAPTYLQANLLVLPSAYADDFRTLCLRNPVPCPLLAESRHIGSYSQLTSHLNNISGDQIANDLDLRHDIAKYNVYHDGALVKSDVLSVADEWNSSDHVAFLIGCSFSFESALTTGRLMPPHIKHGRNVPMYRTCIPLCSAGVFEGVNYVVSMRAYSRGDVGRVRELTRPYLATHGEPIAWGWDGAEKIGIGAEGIMGPDWGDQPVTIDGLPLAKGMGEAAGEIVPVFWACGVTPQDAVIRTKLKGTVIAHSPGHMLVMDLRDWDILRQGE